VTTALLRVPRLASLQPLVTGLSAVTASLLITALLVRVSPLTVLAAVVVGSIAAWMAVSDRYELSLAVLMLYLALVDGYVKLRIDTSWATLIRDLFLYAIVLGALVRAAVTGKKLSFPPLAGWVLAFCLVTLVQVFNPPNASMSTPLASVRPHIEFVPLFFLAFLTMTTKRRLGVFLTVLVTVGAVNGVVNVMQFDLTPEEFAAWGPGYERKILSNELVSPRAFLDEASGEARTRPFGLGADQGFGGMLAVLAIPGLLALILTLRRRLLLVAPLCILGGWLVIAVITSQARVVVVSAVLSVLIFAALATAARRIVPTMLVLVLALGLAFAAVSLFVSGREDATFRNYDTVTPGRLVDTTFAYRKDTIKQVPDYIREFPLGAGLGTGGPGAGFTGFEPTRKLNAESEWTYLLIEVGGFGMVLLTAFNLRLFGLALVGTRRLPDSDTRLMVAAIATPLFVMFAGWIVGIATASTPGSAYLWFAAGVIAYWLAGGRGTQIQHAPAEPS